MHQKIPISIVIYSNGANATAGTLNLTINCNELSVLQTIMNFVIHFFFHDRGHDC